MTCGCYSWASRIATGTCAAYTDAVEPIQGWILDDKLITGFESHASGNLKLKPTEKLQRKRLPWMNNTTTSRSSRNAMIVPRGPTTCDKVTKPTVQNNATDGIAPTEFGTSIAFNFQTRSSRGCTRASILSFSVRTRIDSFIFIHFQLCHLPKRTVALWQWGAICTSCTISLY